MRTPVYEITVDGADISSTIQPLLISVTVRHVDGQMSSADIELDDSYGQIALPRSGAQIVISLGYLEDGGAIPVFYGFTNDPCSNGGGHGGGGGGKSSHHHTTHAARDHSRSNKHLASRGSRQQGRILVLTATSADPTQSGKAAVEMHQDGGTLGDFLNKVFGKAGISVMVDDSIGQVSRDYWVAANESPWALGARLMREVGGSMNIFGPTAVFTARDSADSASGQALTGIEVAWGDNLISWSIKPDIARTSYDQFATRWYDMDGAKWQTETQGGASGGSSSSGSSGGSSGVTMTERWKAPDQDKAQRNNASNAAAADQDKGEGDEVTIEGEPAAQLKAPCSVDGIRDGVDGGYTVSAVTHHVARGAGFTTILGLKSPQGGAGTDSR